MNLEPTGDARIFQTQWTPQGLIESKTYYAKVDDLLFYVTAHRGPTHDQVADTEGKVKGLVLNDSDGAQDDSLDCFNALVKHLNSPAK